MKINKQIALTSLALLVVINFILLTLRYANINFNVLWLYELAIYAQAFAIAFGCATVMLNNEHIRMIKYKKNKYDTISFFIFALPFFSVLIFTSTKYAFDSIFILESSIELSGLPTLFILKALIPLFALFMLIACLKTWGDTNE